MEVVGRRGPLKRAGTGRRGSTRKGRNGWEVFAGKCGNGWEGLTGNELEVALQLFIHSGWATQVHTRDCHRELQPTEPL